MSHANHGMYRVVSRVAQCQCALGLGRRGKAQMSSTMALMQGCLALDTVPFPAPTPFRDARAYTMVGDSRILLPGLISLMSMILCLMTPS